MMFHKATLFGDHVAAQKVLQAATPAAAKAIGREVLGFNQTLWEQKRFEIVVNATVAKFAQHPLLGDFLQSTGDRVLVEASPVDPIWGIGLAQDSPAAADPRTWKGLNLLGFALMEVRQILQNT